MRAAILGALFLAVPAIAADDKPAVKEIATKDLKVTFPKGGKATEPTEIKTADDLAKSPVLKDSADDIKKQVDFAKEKLVLFTWSGSGGDRIIPVENTAGGFIHSLGLTRDLRMHVKLFVVPKDAEVKVSVGKK
jgi:hypothetical protein